MRRFDSGTTVVRLWYLYQTQKARLYSKVPTTTGREIDDNDKVWIPLSIIEHTTKRQNEHEIKLPYWFIEKAGL